MGIQYKLEKLPTLSRPVPQMPDPVMLAIGWLNNHGQQGWGNAQATLEFVAAPHETVLIGPAVDVRGERHILLVKQDPEGPAPALGVEWKLEKVPALARPVPQMPDPLMLAIGWLNNLGKEGWTNPDLTLTHTAAPVETVVIGPTIAVRGEPHILLRRSRPLQA